MSRQVAIAKAKVAGYHQDSRDFTHLRVDAAGMASYETLLKAWRQGWAAKQAGVRCECRECAA